MDKLNEQELKDSKIINKTYELNEGLKKISDSNLEDIVINGINNIFYKIQAEIGQEYGDFAGMYHEDAMEKKLIKYFKEYAKLELENEKKNK